MSESKKMAGVLSQLSLRGALVGVVLAVGVFASWALMVQPNHNQQRIAVVSKELLGQQINAVDALIKAWQKRLQGLAKDPSLMAAFEQNDAQGLAMRQQQLEYSFSDVDVQLITLGRLGIAGVDRTIVTSNIEMDLLRQASEGKAPLPEAYQLESVWKVAIVMPVLSSDGAYTSGVILIRMPVQRIMDVMADLSARGKIQFAQNFNNKRHVIAAMGDADASAPVHSVPLPAIHLWQLEFSPNERFIADYRESSASLWMMLLLVLVGIVGGSVWAARLINKLIESDLFNLSLPTPLAFQLTEFAEAHAKLRKTERKKEEAVVAPVSPSVVNEEPELTLDLDSFDEVMDESLTLELETFGVNLSDTIFRAYDIRGVAETELTDDVVSLIGQAVGSESIARGETHVVVAMDGRLSSSRIKQALAKGLQASGCHVIDIGMVPTPVLYFATHQLNATSGVMVTGSHNPSEYNGLKMVIAGKTLSGDEIQGLKRRIELNQLVQGQGSYQTTTIHDEYVDFIVKDIAIAQPLKVVIDCGNGVPGMLAPQLFSALGCDVVPLYCEVDGRFPNHHPDPSEAKNLRDLIAKVHEVGADLGIAFDGDGDRVGAVTAKGHIVPADRLLMLFAEDVVSRNPGADILYDVKCTRFLASLISSSGGRPIMWKTGHSFMKEKMAETGALLGGEYSGHIFFKERWFGFDDGLYSAARLLEILSAGEPDLDAQLAQFPECVNTPEIKIATSETLKFDTIERIAAQGNFAGGKVTTLDGVRVDFPDGWGLIRASNTTPMLILRFEADNQQALDRIITLFKQNLAAVNPTLDFDVK